MKRFGIVLLLAITGFALFGPALVGIDPASQILLRFLEAPSLAHPLGLDHLGRSMLARLAHGAQLSLSMAVLSVLSAAVPGTVLGVLAAWRGGWFERGLSALADAVLALPGPVRRAPAPLPRIHSGKSSVTGVVQPLRSSSPPPCNR